MTFIIFLIYFIRQYVRMEILCTFVKLTEKVVQLPC